MSAPPKRTLSWPAVIVLLVGLLTFAATAIVGVVFDMEHVELIAILGAEAALFATVLAFMRGILGAGVVLLVYVVASSSVACGSSAAAAITPQVVPQSVTLHLDASDGGTITVGGEVWQDARSGGASSETAQSGTEIEAEVDTSVAVPISTGGGATTGTTSTGRP